MSQSQGDTLGDASTESESESTLPRRTMSGNSGNSSSTVASDGPPLYHAYASDTSTSTSPADYHYHAPMPPLGELPMLPYSLSNAATDGHSSDGLVRSRSSSGYSADCESSPTGSAQSVDGSVGEAAGEPTGTGSGSVSVGYSHIATHGHGTGNESEDTSSGVSSDFQSCTLPLSVRDIGTNTPSAASRGVQTAANGKVEDTQTGQPVENTQTPHTSSRFKPRPAPLHAHLARMFPDLAAPLDELLARAPAIPPSSSRPAGWLPCDPEDENGGKGKRRCLFWDGMCIWCSAPQPADERNSEARSVGSAGSVASVSSSVGDLVPSVPASENGGGGEEAVIPAIEPGFVEWGCLNSRSESGSESESDDGWEVHKWGRVRRKACKAGGGVPAPISPSAPSSSAPHTLPSTNITTPVSSSSSSSSSYKSAAEDLDFDLARLHDRGVQVGTSVARVVSESRGMQTD